MLLHTLRVWNCLRVSSELIPALSTLIKAPSLINTRTPLSTMGAPNPSEQNLFSLPHLRASDYEQISKKVTFKALKIPIESLQDLLKGGIKRRAYKRKKFNFVRNGDEGFRYILLDPEAVGKFEDWKSCPVLERNNVEKKLYDYDVTLKYEDFNADEILQAVLPQDIEVPTAFSRIGHIAHINLRDAHLPYKDIIGKVMLDKTQGITTVVNKTNQISNQFRVFNMEVIAGEKDFETMAKEHHCTFHLDFSKVYWNPRLSTEHERIVSRVQGQVVFDVFAGIGPFAIPAAKKGSRVHANDLNPDSFLWLKKNAEVNKVSRKVDCYNLDGDTFITTVVKDKIKLFVEQSDEERPLSVHVVMNLPASAVEFLGAFRGLLTESLPVKDERVPSMSVHCYCFSSEEDVEEDAKRMVEKHLGCTIQYPEIHNVRNVAPGKEMMCVSFEMPLEVLWAQNIAVVKRNIRETAPEASDDVKKPKLEK